MVLLLLAIHQQSLIVKAAGELSGVEACENHYYNKAECNAVGDGFCCRWSDDHGLCSSNIGQSICPQTKKAPIPLKVVKSLVVAEPAPSTSPTKYDDGICDNIKSIFDSQ